MEEPRGYDEDEYDADLEPLQGQKEYKTPKLDRESEGKHFLKVEISCIKSILKCFASGFLLGAVEQSRFLQHSCLVLSTDYNCSLFLKSLKRK